MKKMIIAMLVIATAFTACQKQTTKLPNSAISTPSELQSDATHYYHGNIVTHQNEITSYMSDQSAMLITDQIHATPEIYYFDNQEEEIAFIQNYDVLKPLYTKLIQSKDMREYAVSSGEVAHYNQTGEISQQYLSYCNQYKTRAFYTLFDGLLGAGPSIFIPGPIANLNGLGFDNKAESYAGNFNTGTVFQNLMFGGPSLSFANGTPFPVNTPPRNLPPAFRNNVSSAN